MKVVASPFGGAVVLGEFVADEEGEPGTYATMAKDLSKAAADELKRGDLEGFLAAARLAFRFACYARHTEGAA